MGCWGLGAAILYSLRSKESQEARGVVRLKACLRDFPSGSVVENPPSNAGDTGSIPGRGTKILHAAGHLSLSALTRESSHACCNKEPVQPKIKKKKKQSFFFKKSHLIALGRLDWKVSTSEPCFTSL